MLANIRRHGEIRFGPTALKGEVDGLSDEKDVTNFRSFYDAFAMYEYKPDEESRTAVLEHPYAQEFYEGKTNEEKNISKLFLEEHLKRNEGHFYAFSAPPQRELGPKIVYPWEK